MQQFLKRYSSISHDSCVCRADELSIRKGLSISNEEYIPRWVKRDMKKLKTICCVCGCKDLAKRKSALSYNEICAACNVNPPDPTHYREYIYYHMTTPYQPSQEAQDFGRSAPDPYPI